MKINSNPPLTLLTIVFGLLLFNFFIDNQTLVYLSLIFSGLGVFSLKSSILIETIWFKLSYILSQIIPNVLLAIIFFFILTPIALLSKVFNSKTNFSSKNNQNTTFIPQNKSFDKKSFERAW